jgi:Cu(I)/Ag(I) efflux system membrane protein CusA/SilA
VLKKLTTRIQVIKETMMIEWIIRRSVANRFLVMMGALFLSVWGTWTIINTPVDALPDLSDVQVIIKTSYPGQARRLLKIRSRIRSLPCCRCQAQRPCADFLSLVIRMYIVIFEDGTDLYWARSRVLEYLNQVQGKLPAG